MTTEFSLPFEVTDSAIKRVKFLIEQQNKPDLKLRVYITGGGCNGFQYGFKFDDNRSETDILIEREDVGLLVDSMSAQYLIGGKLDFVENIEGSRFIVTNPNATNTCGCGSSFSI